MNKMCFLKILCYELRRALMNRLFLGLLLMNGLSAWFLLSYDIIRGTAYTAPFSVWSYCTYLGRTLPVAAVTVLLLLSSYYSKKQRQVEVLTAAAPFSPFDQVTIRTVTAGICFLLISLVVILLALLFYMRLFGFRNFAPFILPSVLLLLPCFILVNGLGQLLGSLHCGLIYVLMMAVLVLCNVTGVFDLFGAGYFSSVPLTLPAGADGEPAFTVGAGFIAARLLYLALGAACIYLTAALSARKSRKA